MANKIFGALDTAGGAGGSGSLDEIIQSTLTDGDIAIVVDVNEEAHIYRYESSSTNAESDPQSIRPNDYATSGVWILADLSVEDLKVYGNAVIDGTLTQTGNAGFTGNVDIDGTLTFDGAGPAIEVIKDEDNMASNSAIALATQQSIKAYVDSVAGGLVTSVDSLAGFIVRPKFTWSDTDTILIGAGRYHLLGTAQGENLYKWDSQLTYDFGSGGSNASSEDLGADEWHYLYIDDSALVDDSTALTAAQFINNTTAPTWDASEGGWYNGADRCIGAFYSNSSSQLDEFFHVKDWMYWADLVDTGTTPSTSWTDITMRVPSLATNIAIVALCDMPANYYGTMVWRTNGQTGTSGHYIGYAYNSGSGDNRRDNTQNTFVGITDTSGVIEFKNSVASGGSIYQDGWQLPEGM
jgi:hypothetical protein